MQICNNFVIMRFSATRSGLSVKWEIGKMSEKKRNCIIKVTDLYKTYGKGENEVKAVRGVDLDIYEGELLIILGSSGSGKRLRGGNGTCRVAGGRRAGFRGN